MGKSANRKSRSNEGVILYQNNVGKTVQTSWRPQLPLPKEVVPPTTSAEPNMRSSEVNRRSSGANSNTNTNNNNNTNRKNSYQNGPQISGAGNKKWSFGRLFRKKKEVETESSSEEDRKAGFVTSPKYRKKDKRRSSKHISGGFDHIVVAPTRDNEFFLPFEPIPAGGTHSNTNLALPVEYNSQNRSTNSLDRRGKRDRKKEEVKDAQQRNASSEEEMISLNSSTTFTRYRSDESLGSGGNGNGGQSRRSRAARNERYYKRLSRDGEVSHGQVPVMYAAQPAQRWITGPVPLSVYNGQTAQMPPEVNRPQYPRPVMQNQIMRNSTSLSHMAPNIQVNYGMPRPAKNLQNTVTDNKRSISFDSQIHLQNAKKPLPPPPPPRDPLRRVNVAVHNDHRPMSYAFDQNSSHAPSYTGMSGRCVSDDRIWSNNTPMYQSASSINNPPPSAVSLQNRRFITRAERDAHPTKKSLPAGIDYRYIAEATPRSRKPIHLLNDGDDQSGKPQSPMVIRTTKSGLPDSAPSNPQLSAEYWRRGREQQQRPESILNKPRSLSSSRAGELRSGNIPMYSEVSKPKAKPVPTDEVDSVISGKLLIKPSIDSRNNYVEIRNNANKSNSMPNHYQKREPGLSRLLKADSPTPNKYDEYVAEKRVRNILDHASKLAPDPPQRKVVSKPLGLPSEPDVIMRKKPTNLEDAINELEAIYKSLKLGDESLLDRAERRDIPTPTNFEKYAETHPGEFLDDDDDDEPAGEPDLVRDDFAYRNIKHANLAVKTVGEKQPPFGIPVGPIAISPRSDYLHVTPEKDCFKVRTGPFKYPDIVCDDLAVRTLRKDPPGQVKPHFVYPSESIKKKRATRTQSANIYTLIQRNAAKPSGGDVDEFLALAKTLERAGSMSDIHKDNEETDDVPSTLQLLRNIREQEQGSPKVIPFRHPSQGGAICSLPIVLSKDVKPPIPLPRTSLSPDPEKTKMEDALNKIAKEAKESSEKLTRDLMELRRGALITASRTKVSKPSIERDLEQIEAVSEAAKRCRHMLLDTIPPQDAEELQQDQNPPRRLVSEDKLIKAIDQVSNAANAVCEKILNEIVTAEPPVIVQNPVEVKNPLQQKLVMPSLIQKLDPSSARIGEIAERCMRQISELNDPPDYDNLYQQVQVTACNNNNFDSDRMNRSDADLLIVPGSGYVTAAENEEEIDKIMKECEQKARVELNKAPVKAKGSGTHSDGDKTTTTATTTSTSSSSSDCLKSSSPSTGPQLSSSITSFNPYSSSDYIKSPSSEFHAPSTDPIKTFSTTSYDVQSSSVTPNITNSPFSYSTPSPPPPLNLTPVCSSGGERGERSGSGASQYNSSEELAMIFGIEKSSPTTTTTGKKAEVVECTVPSPVGVFGRSEPNKPEVLPICAATTATATNPEFCESVLVCKLDTIDEDLEEVSPCRQVSKLYLPSYASNISIIVTSDMGDDDGSAESPRAHSSAQQLDSLSSIEESSNPDSGNVSLSDFPVQSPVNASLELELAHNSRFEVAKRFVNEITIGTEDSKTDYLRTLFAQDELSTSFSNEESVTVTFDDDQFNSKDQHSPGQLLHEVLSQVSRINAGSNRRQLISQLENISECTKIVEDLSERLSHQASKLQNREDINEVRSAGTHRVRFSDECDSDEEDESECIRSLQLLGHDLSSSEESIPPLGEIFNVPYTDSENEGDDSSFDEQLTCGNALPEPTFFFNERERSFVEECNNLKEALARVVQSREVCVNHATEEDNIQKESSALKSLELEESLSLSSEVVSVIEVVDSSLKDSSLQCSISEVLEDESLPLSSDVLCLNKQGNFVLNDSDQKESFEDHFLGPDSCLESSGANFSSKSFLSPVNISMKIVNQVSKVSIVECDDTFESFSQKVDEFSERNFDEVDSAYSQASEVIVVDSEPNYKPEHSATDILQVFDKSSEVVLFESRSQFECLQRQISDLSFDISDMSFRSTLDVSAAPVSESISFSKIEVSELKDAESLSDNEDADLTKLETNLNTFQKVSNEVPSEESSSSIPHPPSTFDNLIKPKNQSQQSLVEDTSSLKSSSPSSSSEDSSPSTSSKSLSLLAQPRPDDRMTTLEHVLLVCTVGVVTGNDFITMLAVIIGVLTVIAMVLL